MGFVAACSQLVGAQNNDVPQPQPMSASVIRGHVYYEDSGRPVKRTSVMLMSMGRGGGGGREASGVTDNNGKIEFRNVQAGQYWAVINAPGVVSPIAYLNILSGRDEMSDELLALPSIMIDGVSGQELQIPARRGGAISGRVSYPDGDAAIGVSVSVLRKVGEEFLPSIPNMSAISSLMMGGAGSFSTDDRGVFRFAGLPAGEYVVKVTENVQHSKTPSNRSGDAFFESMLYGSSSMVSIFYKDVFEQEKAELLKVEFGQEIGDVYITLPERELKRLHGKVVAAKDKLPIRNARITINREGEKQEENEYRVPSSKITYTNGKGEWEYVEIPPGKYSVVVNAENSEFDDVAKAYGVDPEERMNYAMNAAANAANAIAYAMNTPASGARQVDPKPPAKKFAKKTLELEVAEKDPTEQVVELSYGSVISGTVSVEKNADLPDGLTIISSGDKEETGVSTSVPRNDYVDGQIVEKKASTFRLEAVPSGKRSLTVHIGDAEYYVKSATAGGTDLLADQMDFKEGEDLTNVKVVLSKEFGTVNGLIVDEGTKPFPRYDISFIPTDKVKMRNSSYYRHARSSDSGEFEVKLPPFEYAVVKLPKNFKGKSITEVHRWIADNVKDAQTFTVEAGKSQKLTIKRRSDAPKP